MRINKLFSNYGICSRKETNKLIEEERIKVNGVLCVLGQWVEEDKDKILLDDKPICKEEKIYIAFNKPVGITCTAQMNVKSNIIDFIKYPKYIFPVGRLDKESQGLIIMTNDGDLANAILECDNMHEKEYVVKVNKKIDKEFLNKMSEGVEISGHESSRVKRISDTVGVYKVENNEDYKIKEQNQKKDDFKTIELKNIVEFRNCSKNTTKTRPCKIRKINENTFGIVLTQGLNKQIRKMCGALGYKVIKLERIRIMNINIGGIELGKWRYLSEEEVRGLEKGTGLIKAQSKK